MLSNMGNVHLVTGYAGAAHITAADQGSFNAAIFGAGQYVLDRGSKLAATVVTNNQIRIADGDLLMQGRHIRLDSYVDLTIDSGTQSRNRNDLIVARYTRNSSTGVEDCNIVVIKGTATTGTASDPSYTAKNLLDGNVTQNDMPLYRVPLSGITVGTLVKLFDEVPSLSGEEEILTIDKGGTGATSKAAARKNLGITSGTAAPSGGASGDIYFQII
jgi:hypothetical protein